MNQEPVIELRNVGVCYARRSGFMRQSKFWALHDVSFDLRHGETLGVIGHNGAGKSTLLRLLAGILSPDHGKIVTRAGRVSLQSLQVGFVPYLSGRDNAILSGIMLGLRRCAVLEKMDEIRDFAELGDFFDEPVRSYSSGMRARLGFAVAFQADPDVILIDEVLGVGDAAFREKSAAAMRTKIASDKTVVVVTHSVDTVEELCDRVIWIDHGITRAMGGTREVLAEFQKALPRRAAG